MFDVICPYCQHDFDVCVDDGQHCEQEAYEAEVCPNCEKTMMVGTSWYASRDAFAADCLNGDVHGHNWHKVEIVAFVDDGMVSHKGKKCSACGKCERLKD